MGRGQIANLLVGLAAASLLIAVLVAGTLLDRILVALIAAFGLAAAAIAAAVGHRAPTVPRDLPEYDRFQVLSDRLEKGIEKLKDLQWELTDNETRYRDLLDSQNDIITRVDARGRLTFVNRAFCRTFAVEAGEVLGTPFKPDVLQHQADAREATEPGRRQRFEKLVMTADGPRWFAFEQTAISGDGGEIREIQLLGRDITEQRRVQTALAEARDQAEAANRAKSRFLAAMSHEIRTPMNGILGMANLLSETDLSAEQRAYVTAVDHSAKKLLTIIDEILDLSKIEAGKLEIHPAPFLLDECLQSVVELMGPRAREKQLDLAWRLDPDLPRTVIGDETRVRQILLNLLGNAVKFTDAGGITLRARRVALVASPSGDSTEKPQRFCLEVEVADSGAGIAENLMQNLFAEFEQADDAVRRKRSGTGLGLAISRRLARAMDGDIEVESTLGVGSTFRARMVLLAQPGMRPVLPVPVERRLRLVLVVSSRVQQRMIMQETLRSLGIENEVASPDTALETLGRARLAGVEFDTFITDVEEGPQAVGRLISKASVPGQRPPRAVLVVDQAGGSHLEAFKSVGCDAYLVRPVRPASLVTQLGLDHSRGEARAMAADAEAGATIGPSPVSMTRGRRILLVEDNDINALLARRMSEKAGCIVHHAPSGPAALDWCEDLLAEGGEVDLVLMDIHMPDMDGFETARRVRRIFAAGSRVAPPIVALTANAFAEDRKHCLEAGLDDYLAKPFDRSELEALLRKWCATEQAPRDGSIDGFAA